MARRDSMDKIRLKGGPKEYKSGPGVTGRQRLERSARALLLRAARFQRKKDTAPEDAAWALSLVTVLQVLLGVDS
jgi:hypothetical protein